MAKKKVSFARAVAGDQSINKIGTYKESTGGGTPIPKGEKLEDHPEAIRVQQPRDEKGQFTYNAANAKPLKYGPSRGDTIPPFLRGIKLTFAIKSKSTINYNNLIYLSTIDMTAEEFIDNFKEYDSKKGFGILMQEIGLKKGKKAKTEKESIEKEEQGIVSKGDKKEEIYTVGYHGDKDEFLNQFKKGKNVKPKTPKGVYTKIPENPTPKQPETPKVEESKPVKPEAPKQPETPKENPYKKEIDAKAIKENPVKWVQDNEGLVKEVLKIAPQMKISKVVQVFSKGVFKNLQEFKDFVEQSK